MFNTFLQQFQVRFTFGKSGSKGSVPPNAYVSSLLTWNEDQVVTVLLNTKRIMILNKYG